MGVELQIHARGCLKPWKEYDIVIRYSDEAKKQIGYLRNNGMYRWKGSSKNISNDGIKLVVLCDRYTFNSATMLCV